MGAILPTDILPVNQLQTTLHSLEPSPVTHDRALACAYNYPPDGGVQHSPVESIVPAPNGLHRSKPAIIV